LKFERARRALRRSERTTLCILTLQTSALKSQIADYHPNRQAVEPGQSTTTVASIPQSASNASPPAPEQQRGATKYTPQDAQEMTKALRKFRPIINGKLLPAIDSALHLVNVKRKRAAANPLLSIVSGRC